jgi:hypothetical protein
MRSLMARKYTDRLGLRGPLHGLAAWGHDPTLHVASTGLQVLSVSPPRSSGLNNGVSEAPAEPGLRPYHLHTQAPTC